MLKKTVLEELENAILAIDKSLTYWGIEAEKYQNSAMAEQADRALQSCQLALDALKEIKSLMLDQAVIRS